MEPAVLARKILRNTFDFPLPRQVWVLTSPKRSKGGEVIATIEKTAPGYLVHAPKATVIPILKDAIQEKSRISALALLPKGPARDFLPVRFEAAQISDMTRDELADVMELWWECRDDVEHGLLTLSAEQEEELKYSFAALTDTGRFVVCDPRGTAVKPPALSLTDNESTAMAKKILKSAYNFPFPRKILITSPPEKSNGGITGTIEKTAAGFLMHINKRTTLKVLNRAIRAKYAMWALALLPEGPALDFLPVRYRTAQISDMTSDEAQEFLTTWWNSIHHVQHGLKKLPAEETENLKHACWRISADGEFSPV
ncbi:MAG: hypothetical protein V2B18_17170 [Pseudomonadota bacterium]